MATKYILLIYVDTKMLMLIQIVPLVLMGRTMLIVSTAVAPTSLNQHGNFASFGALAEYVHHLVVRQVLHIPLVHLHDDVTLPQPAASWVVHDLLDALAASRRAVGNGEAEALVALFHVHGDELGLRGDGRS